MFFDLEQMMPSAAFDELLAAMEKGDIIARIVLPAEQITAMLDKRDRTNFDPAWVAASERVAKRRSAEGSGFDEDPGVIRLRELAYLQSYHRWESPDLCGYISDDFGLIGNALIQGIDDAWIQSLLNKYLNGVFPSEE